VKKEGERRREKEKQKDIKRERKKRNKKVHLDCYIAKPLQSCLVACDGQQQRKEFIR
jgi:hypothetical protein